MLFIALCTLLVMAVYEPVQAQCSMCRAVAQSGAMDESQKTGRGLNAGILYLLATPYLLGGVAFFVWRKHRRKKTAIS